MPLIDRHFTEPSTWNPRIEYPSEHRTAEVREGDRLVFQQKDVEVPEHWSDMALAMAAQKYFYGERDTPERETSIYEMVRRVASTIALWGGFKTTPETRNEDLEKCESLVKIDRSFLESPFSFLIYSRPRETKQPTTEVYFQNYNEFKTFYCELYDTLISQRAFFNSPVWFNVGTKGPWAKGQQCSACFINRMEDSFDDENGFGILDMPKTEGRLFKRGSGSGFEISRVRSSRECVSGGGRASGALSFAKTTDRSGRAIRSGGRVRRAAMMRTCADDYGDIIEFIRAKSHEETKAKILAKHGYGNGIDSESYDTVAFQGANFTVRISDALMKAAENDSMWELRSRVSLGAPEGEKLRPNHFGNDSYVIEKIKARDLLREIAKCAWESGDPGVQFHDTINDWHTCARTDKIWSSNPCSEFLFLDNTACNLSSINLIKFFNEKEIDIKGFCHTVKVMATAMEILVSNSEYPTDTIRDMSHDYRPLGLGYGNLGAALMVLGIPYDSPDSRNFASIVTSLMSAQAYEQSVRIAELLGPFPGYENNKESMAHVLDKHLIEATRLTSRVVDWEKMARLSDDLWLSVVRREIVRNSQMTVIAPTGTIGLVMDLDTTGAEPLLAHVTRKHLIGGGVLVKESTSVRSALINLDYADTAVSLICDEIQGGKALENCSLIRKEDLPIFDTSFLNADGKRALSWQAHVHMLAAIQPFVSGSISKTINMPEDVTIKDIEEAYKLAWKLGLKCLAVYRDNCKLSQPIASDKSKMLVASAPPQVAGRKKPPRKRNGTIQKFRIGGHKGYLIVGEDKDGRPIELFMKMGDQGSAINSWADAFCIMFSFAVQHGAPLEPIVDKLKMHRGEPSGFTDDPEIRNTPSVIAYVARRLGLDYLPESEQIHLGLKVADIVPVEPAVPTDVPVLNQSGLVCGACGGFNVNHIGAANCLQCFECGWSDGGCAG